MPPGLRSQQAVGVIAAAWADQRVGFLAGIRVSGDSEWEWEESTSGGGEGAADGRHFLNLLRLMRRSFAMSRARLFGVALGSSLVAVLTLTGVASGGGSGVVVSGDGSGV